MNPTTEFGTFEGRDRELLLLGQRYGMLTAAVLHRWRFQDLSAEALRKWLSRFAERGWLARHTLNGQEPYYVLGGKAVTALSLRRGTGALGQQALLEHYGVLLACARRDADVYTEDEFRSTFPDFTQPGFSAKNYFLDASRDPARLGLLIVDHDKSSSRMVHKVGKKIGTIFKTGREKFRQEILSGGFAIHIVTATEGKRADLEAAFRRKPPRNVPVFVEAYPDELGDFFLLKRR